MSALIAFVVLVSQTPGAARPHRVVVEVNVPGTSAYGTVLGNVKNLQLAFAPEKVEVEVVCHGPGINMLFNDSKATRPRVLALIHNGIHFAACHNTMKTMKLSLKDLIPGVAVVPSGVAEVVRKQESGWSYLKGAY